jgi:hypothetical protein
MQMINMAALRIRAITRSRRFLSVKHFFRFAPPTPSPRSARADVELRLAAEAITPSTTLSAIRDEALKRRRGNDEGHLAGRSFRPC